LSVPGGTVCALLGPNGAGKTTAVRILATLTKPDSGTAIVAGHDVTREPRRVSALAAACRQLFGTPEGPAGAWPLAHPVTASLAWTALLLAVFVPLATARYARPA